MMKKLIIYCLLIIQIIGFTVRAQTQAENSTTIAQNTEEIYDAYRLGALNAAMKSCFIFYKSQVYFNINQETSKIINTLSNADRNQAMGAYQNVLATRIFEGKSLTSAYCERIINSNWISYLERSATLE